MKLLDVNPERIYGLDLLRAAAILCVVYSHGYSLVAPYVNPALYNILLFDGVGIFFVLSGFLIGSILIKSIERTDFAFSHLMEFWLRRWFRTLPNYFLILVLLAAVGAHWSLPGVQGYADAHLWKYFVFAQNISTAHPAFFGEAWSLAIEEWFYLLLPMCLFLSLRLPKFAERESILLFWIVTIILAGTLTRIGRIPADGFSDPDIWDGIMRRQVITRLDSIMYGVLGAYVHHYHAAFWRQRQTVLMWFGLVLLAYDKAQSMLLRDIWYRDFLSITIPALAVLFMLPKMSSIRTGKGVLFSVITLISVISYSMYLINLALVQGVIMPSLFALAGLTDYISLKFALMKYALFWFITLGLSWLLYRYFERPIMNLRALAVRTLIK